VSDRPRTWKDIYFSQKESTRTYRVIAVYWMCAMLTYVIPEIARGSGWSVVADVLILVIIIVGLGAELYGLVWRRGANKMAEALVEDDE